MIHKGWDQYFTAVLAANFNLEPKENHKSPTIIVLLNKVTVKLQDPINNIPRKKQNLI
jgi:hypothetical protein